MTERTVAAHEGPATPIQFMAAYFTAENGTRLTMHLGSSEEDPSRTAVVVGLGDEHYVLDAGQVESLIKIIESSDEKFPGMNKQYATDVLLEALRKSLQVLKARTLN